MGNVADAVIEGVSLVSFPGADGVTLEEVGGRCRGREEVRSAMSTVVLVPGCDFHARSRSDLTTLVLRCQEVVCAWAWLRAHLGWQRHLPPAGPIPRLGKLGAPNGNTPARSTRLNRKVLSCGTHLGRASYIKTPCLRKVPLNPSAAYLHDVGYTRSV